MPGFLKRFVDIVLRRKKSRLHLEYKKITKKSNSRASTFYAGNDATLELNAKKQAELEKRDFCAKNIVSKYLDNPDRMLDYIKDHGTAVYRLDNADILLGFIREDEGFLLPKKGLKAFYLNLLLAIFKKSHLKLSMSTPEMFVLRDLPVNVYTMLHQFHKWMSFKMDLPGCEDSSEQLLRDMMENRSGPMSVEEILALKEAIARDREAIDFVVNLSKEFSGAKKALSKIKEDGSASV